MQGRIGAQHVLGKPGIHPVRKRGIHYRQLYAGSSARAAGRARLPFDMGCDPAGALSVNRKGHADIARPAGSFLSPFYLADVEATLRYLCNRLNSRATQPRRFLRAA